MPRTFHLAAIVIGCTAGLSCGGDKVSGPVQVASVGVVIAAPSVAVGTTTQASATARDIDGSILDGRSIAWSSSDPQIASVSSDGVVTALRVGTAQITATSEGKEGSAILTVTPPPVATVTVTLASGAISAGSTTSATASLKDSNGDALTGRTITWSSSDVAIATVNGNGVVTAVSTGNATITATSEGKTGSAPLAVTPAAVHTITVVIADPSIQVGGATQAGAVARDANGNVLTGRPIVWTSNNPGVASVSTQGVVTGLDAGWAPIVAASEGKTGSEMVTVGAPVAQVRQRSLAVGHIHACAIGVDGFTYCWGNGSVGQLGNRIPESDVPIRITGDHRFEAVSAAHYVSYGLTANGELYCWGGLPCDPTAGNTISPSNGPAVPEAKRMETSRTIEVIGAGSGHGTGYQPMCAIGVGNVAYCWGRNNIGQLGFGYGSNETLIAPDKPVVGNHAFEDVASGVNHTCALTRAGRAYCWGDNPYGALGDGTGAASLVPRAVAGNHVFKMIGTGGAFSCGLTTEGKVYCWGVNDVGQIGTTTGGCLGISFPCSATPVAVNGDLVFESIDIGHQGGCGLTSTGDIFCWGIGFGATPKRFRSVPADEPGGVRFTTVVSGGSYLCAISTAGDAWCRDPAAQPVLVPGGVKFRSP